MKNWKAIFDAIPPVEQDKLALLRLIECSNGVIQHSYRSGEDDTLTTDEVRTAMKFSMGCMKTQSIPVGEEVVVFAPETAEIMKEVRRLYISGFKNNNEEDYDEFMNASVANLNAIGKERILLARRTIFEHIDEIPPHTLEWGLGYIFSIMNWSYEDEFLIPNI